MGECKPTLSPSAFAPVSSIRSWSTSFWWGVPDSPAPWKQSWRGFWILHLGHTSQVCVSAPLLSFVREIKGKAEFFKETLQNICFQTEVFMPLPQSFPVGLLCPGTELVLSPCSGRQSTFSAPQNHRLHPQSHWAFSLMGVTFWSVCGPGH